MGAASHRSRRAAAGVLGLVLGALAGPAPALAQSAPPAPSSAAAVTAFRALDVAQRHEIRMLLIAAGYGPAVSTDTDPRRLHAALQRFQQEQGFPATGQFDGAQILRLHALADPLLRLWRLQPVRHPGTQATLWVPAGLGLSTKASGSGLQFDNPPHQTLRIYFHHLPGAALARTMKDVVDRRQENGFAIDDRSTGEDFFAVTASKPGVETVIRYHATPDGLVGFSVFWNSGHTALEARRLVTLMSDLFRASRAGETRSPPLPLGGLPPLPPPPAPPEPEFPVGTLPPPPPQAAPVPPVEPTPSIDVPAPPLVGSLPIVPDAGASTQGPVSGGPASGAASGSPTPGGVAVLPAPSAAPDSMIAPEPVGSPSTGQGPVTDRPSPTGPVVVGPPLPSSADGGARPSPAVMMPQSHAGRGGAGGAVRIAALVPPALRPGPGVVTAPSGPAQGSLSDAVPPSLRPAPRAPRTAAPRRPEGHDVQPRQQSGSGFFASADGLILTNAHVVDGCDQATAFTVAGEVASAPFAVTILARNARHDLALLKADRRHVTGVARLRPDVRQGESVAAYGFPLAGLLSRTGNFTTGTVTATRGLGDDERLLQVSVPVQAGNSGGPLLDAQGAVVGIVVGKLNAEKVSVAFGDLPQNVNFAIKAGLARAMLPEDGDGVAQAPNGTPLKPEDLARRAQAITVGIACEARTGAPG
ncbi:trypsin-like peptidase domain-containing protein [Alsobacter sp. R-9]